MVRYSGKVVITMHKIAGIISSAITLVCAAVAPALADGTRYDGFPAMPHRHNAVTLTVDNDFGVREGSVRLSVYKADNFLKMASLKLEARFENGVAVVPVSDLTPGEYAFVAYYDANGDGKLNRNIVGAPKEPFGFSNGVRPKLSKPKFDEAKVVVNEGSVVKLTIED